MHPVVKTIVHFPIKKQRSGEKEKKERKESDQRKLCLLKLSHLPQAVLATLLFIVSSATSAVFFVACSVHSAIFYKTYSERFMVAKLHPLFPGHILWPCLNHVAVPADFLVLSLICCHSQRLFNAFKLVKLGLLSVLPSSKALLNLAERELTVRWGEVSLGCFTLHSSTQLIFLMLCPLIPLWDRVSGCPLFTAHSAQLFQVWCLLLCELPSPLQVIHFPSLPTGLMTGATSQEAGRCSLLLHRQQLYLFNGTEAMD